MLAVESIETYYGQSHILQGVSLEVETGEAVALLGRNGAGKTTTMRSIMGLTPPRRGTIRLDGAVISGRPAFAIARLGVAYVPSGRRIFSGLSVRQNLLLAEGSARNKPQGGWTLDRVFDMFPKLRELETRAAGFLSGGEQQMLKLARALLGNPKLLLLDEPTEGLAPVVVKELGIWIERLKAERLTILLSEQNAPFALRLADRGYILEKGRIRHSAAAAGMAESPEIRAYLGIASKPAA
ncbi:MAG TPA: ABC transporter ATP-binding protein [Acidiphilium sp.]